MCNSDSPQLNGDAETGDSSTHSTVKQASSTASSGSERESGPSPPQSRSLPKHRKQLPRLGSLPSPLDPTTIVPPPPDAADPMPGQRGPLIGQIHLPGQPVFSSRHRAFEQFREWEKANWESVRTVDTHTRWDWYIHKRKLPSSLVTASSSSSTTPAPEESVSDYPDGGSFRNGLLNNGACGKDE